MVTDDKNTREKKMLFFFEGREFYIFHTLVAEE